MSMQVQECSMESNINQGRQVEFLSKDTQAVSLHVSAIEGKIFSKEGGKNFDLDIEEDEIFEFPEEVSTIINDSDTANNNRGDQRNSFQKKSPWLDSD